MRARGRLRVEPGCEMSTCSTARAERRLSSTRNAESISGKLDCVSVICTHATSRPGFRSRTLACAAQLYTRSAKLRNCSLLFFPPSERSYAGLFQSSSTTGSAFQRGYCTSGLSDPHADGYECGPTENCTNCIVNTISA